MRYLPGCPGSQYAGKPHCKRFPDSRRSGAAKALLRLHIAAGALNTLSGDVKTVEANPFRGVITVVAPKALARYNKAATAATTWFLLPAPGSENPALVKASLRGYENPDIRQKNDTGVAVGGGQLSPDEGSFLDDTISYRGRHVVGAATVMPFAVYASTGA